MKKRITPQPMQRRFGTVDVSHMLVSETLLACGEDDIPTSPDKEHSDDPLPVIPEPHPRSRHAATLQGITPSPLTRAAAVASLLVEANPIVPVGPSPEDQNPRLPSGKPSSSSADVQSVNHSAGSSGTPKAGARRPTPPASFRSVQTPKGEELVDPAWLEEPTRHMPPELLEWTLELDTRAQAAEEAEELIELLETEAELAAGQTDRETEQREGRLLSAAEVERAAARVMPSWTEATDLSEGENNPLALPSSLARPRATAHRAQKVHPGLGRTEAVPAPLRKKR